MLYACGAHVHEDDDHPGSVSALRLISGLESESLQSCRGVAAPQAPADNNDYEWHVAAGAAPTLPLQVKA